LWQERVAGLAMVPQVVGTDAQFLCSPFCEQPSAFFVLTGRLRWIPAGGGDLIEVVLQVDPERTGVGGGRDPPGADLPPAQEAARVVAPALQVLHGNAVPP